MEKKSNYPLTQAWGKIIMKFMIKIFFWNHTFP